LLRRATTLVAGIKAGKVDTSKLEPVYAQFDKVTEEHQKKQAEALNSLHAALEPAQQKALVAAIQKDGKPGAPAAPAAK